MANALLGEADATLAAEGGGGPTVLHLVMNNSAWFTVEDLLGKSYLDVFGELLVDEARGGSHKLKTMAHVLYGATRRHHPALTIDDCADLIKEHSAAVLAPLGKAMRGSIKLKEPEPGEAMPAETPATTQSGTGTA